MKKILLLTLDFPPNLGGVARYLWELAAQFANDVTVIAPKVVPKPNDKASSFKIVRHSLLYKRFWPKWLQSFFVVNKYKKEFDVLWVSHILPMGYVAYLVKIFLRRDYFVFLHSMDFYLAVSNPWKKFFAKMILSKASLVVTNSKALQFEVRKFVPKSRYITVYPCLSTGFVDKKVKRANLFPFTLLSVGRLVKRKGHLLVLKALEEIDDHKIGYVIVGNGPELDSLKNEVAQRGLSDQVVFKSNLTDDELIAVYKSADLFVMPTQQLGGDREGFGIVYLEAAGFGLPSVASDIPGVSEAVLHEETGILIQEGNITELADVIRMLHENDKKRQKLGQTAKERVEAEFTYDVQANRLRPYLESK